MNLDGNVPEDNPFPGSLVYSYGHRNPQGLAWSEKGDLYSAEHGPSGANLAGMRSIGSKREKIMDGR